jgi:hypothetical protein
VWPFCPRPALLAGHNRKPNQTKTPPRFSLSSILPSPHQVQHLPPSLLFSSLRPSSLILLPSQFNINYPSFPFFVCIVQPYPEPSILVLDHYSSSSLVRLWLDTFPFFPFSHFPRSRNDQTSTQILPVVKSPPDTVRANSPVNSPVVFFDTVKILEDKR